MAVVASIFSTLASVISSRWGDNKGANIPIFAGAQSLSGVLMLLFFAVVSSKISMSLLSVMLTSCPCYLLRQWH